MGTLKDKANKKRANRQERNVITPEATKIAGINTPDLSEPARMDVRRYKDRGNVEAVTPVVPDMPDAAPKSIISKDTLSAVQGNAEVQNPAGITNPATEAAKEATKPKTLSDYLAEQRANLVKDKTDAVKMQKYYALTDALGALGRMGGTAVGGAIAGDVLGGASNIPEYQPSRGYVDAFEKAKQANERLRALDDKEFQLAYNKQQRDEERAYAEKKTKEDRAYQAEQARLTREWNKAVADEDFTRQAELKKEILDLQNRYAAADDKRSREYLQLQHDLYNTNHPVMFSDGSVVNLSTQQLEDMFENFNGQTIGGTKINKDNFGEVLRKNPQAFADYLKMIGVSSITTASKEQGKKKEADTKTPVDASFPQHISQIPAENMVAGRSKAVSQETDLAKKWESSEI